MLYLNEILQLLLGLQGFSQEQINNMTEALKLPANPNTQSQAPTQPAQMLDELEMITKSFNDH